MQGSNEAGTASPAFDTAPRHEVARGGSFGPAAMGSASDSLTMRQIAAELGDELARMLVDGFAGTRLYIPFEPGEDSPVFMVLGREAALRLGRRFGGEAVHIPLHKSRAQRQDEHANIARLRLEGYSVRAIAHQIGCSERHIYHVLARLHQV